MRVPFSILLLSFCLNISFAQTYTISGYIKDAKNGESILGATVGAIGTAKGCTSNPYGFYSLSLAAGKYSIKYSLLGYDPIIIDIQLDKNKTHSVELSPSSFMQKEVKISAKKRDENVQSTQMGTIEISTKDVKMLPALMGEVDILRTLQLMPGVISAGEGNSGLYVRGGGPDQNLILLDNAVVYNSGHLFGFFSVFNADAIKHTTLIKGSLPSNYGGRISSVVDIQMKEGNMKNFQMEGGVGIISSRLTVEGPIVKDKASFIFSGRRTYADILARPFLTESQKRNGYYFYDINAKFNYKISEKDRIYLSGYFGQDVFTFGDDNNAINFELPWGNSTATFRWNHLYHSKLFSNTTVAYNDYKFKVAAGFRDITFALTSDVRDISLKSDYDYYPNANNSIKFGFDYTFHQFKPYTTSATIGDSAILPIDKFKYAHQGAIYLSDEFDWGKHVKINAGMRFSYFTNVGPFEKIVFDENGRAIDTFNYEPFQQIATYGGFEPRLSARFGINTSTSIKLGYMHTKQYLHLVSSSTTTLPTDIWVPSSKDVKPLAGNQISLGIFKNFKEDMFETSIEVYYKKMYNLVEFGGDRNDLGGGRQDIDDLFTFGEGNAYGAEFFVKKAKGKWTGWIGYTLAWSNRQFPNLNEGKEFPAKFDRRHDFVTVLTYQLNKKITLSTVFIYGSGNTTTPTIGRYYNFTNQKFMSIYGDRNSYRLPAYHRLDFSCTWVIKDKPKNHQDLNFSVYNVYNRANPFFIYTSYGGSIERGNVRTTAKQVSLFPVIPSITWNFRFF